MQQYYRHISDEINRVYLKLCQLGIQVVRDLAAELQTQNLTARIMYQMYGLDHRNGILPITRWVPQSTYVC